MWRIIPSIPKVLRGNWNNCAVRSAPPTSCHDDDSIDGSFCQSPSPVFFIHRNLCCYRSGKRKKSFKDKTEYAALNKWIQSFKQNWSSTGNPFTLEALGYGTVLLLGIHLSQYYKLWHDQNRRRYSDDAHSQNWLCMQLGQTSLVMPVKSWDNHLKQDHVPLPGHQTSQPEQQKAETTQELKSDHKTGRKPKEKCPEIDTAVKWLDETSMCDISKPDIKKWDDDLLCEFEKDWSALNKHYISVNKNIVAYQYVLDRDITHAISLWHESSELATSSFNLGVCYEFGRGVEINLDKAKQFYEAAAKQGHHKAMYNLARMYLSGNGVTQDIVRATELLKDAATAHLSKPLCDLGVLYASKKETRVKAVEMFTKAAKLKDACGCYNLALCYHTGCGVEQNLCRAVELYKEAAQLGHKYGQLMLALCFQHGLGGLPVDEQSAKAWLNEVKAEHDEQTDERCNSLESYFRLSPSEVDSTTDIFHYEEASSESGDIDHKEIITSVKYSPSINKKTTVLSETNHDNTDFLASIGITGGSFGENCPSDSCHGSYSKTAKERPVSTTRHLKNRKLTSRLSKDLTQDDYAGCVLDVDGVCQWNVDGSHLNKNDAVSLSWTRC